MAFVSFDSQVMIKKDYFEHGKTVNGNKSVQQIKNPRKAIKAKRRHKLTSGELLMLDNTPSQNCDVISRVWLWNASASYYSLALAISDHRLLPKMKYELRRKWFESNNDVIVAADEFLGVYALALFF